MASIKIVEKDLTTASQNDLTSNVVYIPGYAIMGPINEPTYCATAEEFQTIFGTKPYTFKQGEVIATDHARFTKSESDYEPSYIYALDILRKGLPIIFERYFSSNANMQNIWKAETHFTAQVLATNVEQSVTPTSLDSDYAGTLYKETAEGSNEYKRCLLFTSDTFYASAESTVPLDTRQYYNIIKDNPNTQFYEGSDLEKTPVEIIYGWSNQADTYYSFSETLDIPASLDDYIGNYVLLNNLYTLVTNDNKNDLGIVAGTTQAYTKDAATTITASTYNPNYDYYKLTSAGYYEKQSGMDVWSTGNYYIANIEQADNNLTFKAKNPGAYGEHLSWELRNESNGEYEFKIKLSGNSTADGIIEDSEKLFISFDKNKASYYRNVKPRLIDLEYPSADLVSISIPSAWTGKFTLPVINDRTVEFSINDFYQNGLIGSDNVFAKLEDKGSYQLKFMTTGSYPILGTTAVSNILNVAATRGDCIALIDHFDYIGNDAKTTLLSELDDLSGEELKYAAMFTPWATYEITSTADLISLPASFAYLKCLGQATQTNPNWYAVAGVTRGIVSNIKEPSVQITGALADLYQTDDGVSINPIINIKPYGYCIWGNRTLNRNDGLTASSFLNVRMLISDVKKVLYQACRSLTFENNTDVLWLNFKSAVEPTLDRMMTGNGLISYKLIKQQTTKKATVVATVRLVTVEAVENWDITVELTDSYVNVE